MKNLMIAIKLVLIFSLRLFVITRIMKLTGDDYSFLCKVFVFMSLFYIMFIDSIKEQRILDIDDKLNKPKND